jgi:hypothetical protein
MLQMLAKGIVAAPDSLAPSLSQGALEGRSSHREKTINHGEHGAHGEKTGPSDSDTDHRQGEAGASRKLSLFRRVAVLAVVKMNFSFGVRPAQDTSTRLRPPSLAR